MKQHWDSDSNNCDTPNLSQKQLEICEGLLMGDGSIVRQNGTNYGLTLSVTQRPFVEWIEQELEGLTTEPQKIERDEDNWNTVYRIYIMGIAQVSELGEWYSTGKKKFPSNLKLTPTKVRMWYACDGHLQWTKKYSYPMFGVKNESDSVNKLIESFENVGIECNSQYGGERLYIPSSSKSDFFDFIGSSVPGYEYKWTYRDKNLYEELKGG